MGLQILIIAIASIIMTQIAIFSTSIYLHRTLAHRALSLRPVAEFFFRLALWLFTGGDRQQWVAVHRKHHTFTDKEGYLTAIFRGSEVRPEGKNISVTDLNITIVSGDAASRVETVLLAPFATYFPKEKRASGDKSTGGETRRHWPSPMMLLARARSPDVSTSSAWMTWARTGSRGSIFW